MKTPIKILFISLILGASMARAGIVFIQNETKQIYGRAEDAINYGGRMVQTSEVPEVLPFVDSFTVLSGEASTHVTGSLSHSGFHFTHAFQSGGNPLGGDGDCAFEFRATFQVTAPMEYAITGQQASVGTQLGNGSASVYFLLGKIAGESLFECQKTENVTNEAFLLNVEDPLGGDNQNIRSGTPTGILQPGITYRLIISSMNGMNNTPPSGVASNGSFGITFTPTAFPFGAYAASLGLEGPAAAPGAVNFPDGLPNLVRYALALDSTPTEGQLPSFVVSEIKGLKSGVLEYRVRKDLQGVTFFPEFSDDLLTWDPVPEENITVLPDDDATTGRHSATMASEDRVFLRLRAVLP